jgi:hypothetical protein
MKKKSIRTVLFSILISSVGLSSLIGVVAVLLGGFNDALGRALWTIILAVIHSLLSLWYISSQQNKPTRSMMKWSKNALFGSLLISLLICTLDTWDVMSGNFVWNTYQTLAIILLAIFHTEILTKLKSYSAIIETLVYINFFFIAAVTGMLIAIIYSDGTDLGEAFGRLFGAATIINGTLTLLIIIFKKMLTPQHAASNIDSESQHKIPSNTYLTLIFLAIVLGSFQLFGGYFWALFL